MFCFGKSSNVCDQPPTQIVISFDSRKETRCAFSQGAFCSSQIGRVTFISADRKLAGKLETERAPEAGWSLTALFVVVSFPLVCHCFCVCEHHFLWERREKVKSCSSVSVCLMLFIQSPPPAAVLCPCLLIYRSATTNGCSAFGQTCYAVNQWVELNMLPKPCHFIFPQNR